MGAADPIERLVANGFDYRQFSDYHFRVEHRADFWPTTGRWRFPNGESGWGINALISRLCLIPELKPLYDQAPARSEKPARKAKR